MVVESGMGQLQVAVAGLGEGACGRACGQAMAPGTRAPERLGTRPLRCLNKRGETIVTVRLARSTWWTTEVVRSTAVQMRVHGCVGGLQNWGNLKARTVL